MTCTSTPSRSMSSRRTAASQQAAVTGRNSFSPSISMALPAEVCFIQGQLPLPKRSARSGQVRGRKWEWMSMTLTRCAPCSRRSRPHLVRAIRHGLDLDEQLRMRQGRDRHGGARRSIGAEELAVRLVVAVEVAHVDEKGADLDDVA